MTVLLFELVKLLQVMYPTIHVELSMRLVLRCKVKIDLSQLLQFFSRNERVLLARANIHHPSTQLGVIVVVARNSAVAIVLFEEMQFLHALLPNIVRGLNGKVNWRAFS